MRVLTVAIGASLTLATATVGFAGQYEIGPLATPPSQPRDSAPRPQGGTTANSSNIVFSGFVDGGGNLYTAEPIPAVRSDVVIFNGVEQQINDYVTIAGTGLQGQRRFVTETTTLNPDGSFTDTFRIRCVNELGAPADLWPAGLAVGGTPLPHGGVGLGLDLNPAFGGQVPVAFDPNATITALSAEIVSDDVSGGATALPLDPFILPSPSNWNGQLGLVFFGAANDASLNSQITIRITGVTVPEPAAAGVLIVAKGSAALARRRRRHRRSTR